MICKHEEIEMIGHDFYLDEEQNMVEETKFLCLGCSREGVQITIQKPLEWYYDPDQTKLPIQP